MAKPLTAAEKAVLAPYDLNPHPDGKPWDKCCGDNTSDQGLCWFSGGGIKACTCLMRKHREGDSRFNIIMRADADEFKILAKELSELSAKGDRFFCVHRQDGEYHRECAGWAAKFGHKETPNGNERTEQTRQGS